MLSGLVLIIINITFLSTMFYGNYCKGAGLDPVAKTFAIYFTFSRCCIMLIVLLKCLGN